jgi:thioesterase domain-containing protein
MHARVSQGLSTDAVAVDEPMLVAPSDARVSPIFVFYDHQRFRRVAQRLADVRGFMGIGVAPHTDVPIPAFGGYDMAMVARACTAVVRKHQAKGPYLLGGFSFGGRIALEVARQLRAEGETVPQLVVLDTFMPGAHRRRPWKWFVHHTRGFLTVGPRYLTKAGRDSQPAAPSGVPAEIDPNGDRGQQAQRQWHFRAALAATYRPQRYDAPVALFRATQIDIAPHYRVERALGWARIVRGTFDIHDVPSAHLDVMDEARAPAVAETMARYLR